MANKESPLVIAFMIMLKLMNYPIPTNFINMFSIYREVSNTLFFASYGLDMVMDINPRSVTKGENIENTYDFIIVGGGTAGCLLATRLISSKNKYKVLVLEAGAEPTFLSFAPFFNVFQWQNNATMWSHYSVPQRHSCISCRYRKPKHISGKSLGGTMNLGHSIYNRGNPLDFDEWAKITGDEEWSYTNMIKWFKKTENYRGRFEDSSNHGSSTKGTFLVAKQDVEPLAETWIGAAKELNLTESDPNEMQTQTLAPAEVMVTEGKRMNTYDFFLKRELWRKNLKVTRYAFVNKIIFDSQNYAKGVVYRRAHQDIVVKATKEVILCAGVFNTPKLLMHSGVGPGNILREAEVKVVRDMEPVGKNLVDQPGTFYGPIRVSTQGFKSQRNITFASLLQYSVNMTGLLSWNWVSGIGFYSTPDNDNKDYPDIRYTMMPIGIGTETDSIFTGMYDLKKGYMTRFLKDTENADAVWVQVALARPESKGWVKIKDNNHRRSPSIQPNWFTSQKDMSRLVDGMMFLDKLFSTESWSLVGATPVNIQFPGCERYKPKSREYYECLARHFTVATGSIGGSCRMGQNASDSVVDSKLLVHGLKRLRIADASVFPVVPNGHTGAATMAVAEKAADLIIQHWDNVVANHRDWEDEGRH